MNLHARRNSRTAWRLATAAPDHQGASARHTIPGAPASSSWQRAITTATLPQHLTRKPLVKSSRSSAASPSTSATPPRRLLPLAASRSMPAAISLLKAYVLPRLDLRDASVRVSHHSGTANNNHPGRAGPAPCANPASSRRYLEPPAFAVTPSISCGKVRGTCTPTFRI